MTHQLYNLYRDLHNSKTKPEKENKLEKLLFTLKNSLLGRNVVVYTENGYHYGTLIGKDDDGIYLSGYHFNKKLISSAEYSWNSGTGEGMVPKEKVISVSEIPLHIRETQNGTGSQGKNSNIDEYHK